MTPSPKSLRDRAQEISRELLLLPSIRQVDWMRACGELMVKEFERLANDTREECAVIADGFVHEPEWAEKRNDYSAGAKDVAAAIRKGK